MLTSLNYIKHTIFCCLLILFPATYGLSAQTQMDVILEKRANYISAFLTDENSPLDSAGILGLRFFEPDTNYIVEATFEYVNDTSIIEMPTSSGKRKQYVVYGIARFPIQDTVLQLQVYQSLRLRKMEAYADYLFIPFNDFTNNLTTYGGGRYIDLKQADIVEDRLTIDFNSCYNPYCAYANGYSCPVPPIENYLPVYIEAGEKMYVSAEDSDRH
jgi:uncharacterized protein